MSTIVFFLSALVFVTILLGDEFGLTLDPSSKSMGYFVALWLLGVSVSLQLDQVIKKIRSDND